jgi:N-acetylmuramic acid 6-phosphate etherase
VNSTASIVIALDTGPEVLPGSTRLKAGTATKLALNQISTGAMALSGRVFEGYMVGAQPVNVKLRGRAIRIVADLTGLDDEAAARLLHEAGNRIAVAVLMNRSKLDARKAARLLEKHRGHLANAITDSSKKRTRKRKSESK